MKHKTMNVLNCLPAAVQPGAKKAIFRITNAEKKATAEKAIKDFVADHGAKWPKAAAKIVDDQEELLAFFDYPAEHRSHLRTSHPIWVNRSNFSPVRARTKVTRGGGPGRRRSTWRSSSSRQRRDAGDGSMPRTSWPSLPQAQSS